MDWFRRIVDVFGSEPQHEHRSTSIHTSLGNLRATATVHRKRDTVEERLAALENETKELKAELRKKAKEFEEAVETVRDKLSEERRVREQCDKAIEEQMEEQSVGGLRLEAMGVWWLALGSATVPGFVLRVLT